MLSQESQKLASSSQNPSSSRYSPFTVLNHDPKALGRIDKYASGITHIAHYEGVLRLYIVCTGTATYILEGQRINVRQRSMLWIFPGQDHFLVEQSPDFTMWVGLWKREALEIACRYDNSAPLLETAPPGSWHKRTSEEMYVELSRLCEYVRFEGEGKDRDLANTGVLFILNASWRVFQLADQQIVSGMHGVHPTVARAAKLLRERVPAPSVEELAREVGLSPSRLSKLFKTQIGCGIVPFGNRECVQRFIRIYDTGHEISMADAAEQAGFGSYAQFHRVFTEEIGCSPSEWRRKLTQESTRNGALAP